MKQKSKNYLAAAIMLMAGIFFAGCDKNSTEPDDTGVLYEDAAESISATVGDESGGSMESFADLSVVAGGGIPVNAVNPPVYDPATGWWTVTIDRSRANLLMSASVHRVYQYQFLKSGIVLQNRIVGTDTANMLKFKIVSGSGYFRSPRVNMNLTVLKGAWTATKLDKDTIVINSDTTYVRAGADSIITRNMIRTFTHTTTMNFSNVKALRYRPTISGWRDDFHHAVSGTVSGTYDATISFQRGNAYKERSISTSFTINFEGGVGRLAFAGGRSNFMCDLHDGNRKP